MLQIEKNKDKNRMAYVLKGTIDENDDLPKLFGRPMQPVVVDCGSLKSINSLGIRSWINYFNSLPRKDIPLSFVNVPVFLVEQFNMLKDFGCGGTVESLMIPFRCSACGTGFSVVRTVNTIKKGDDISVPPEKCAKSGCSGNAAFDDLIDEFFMFLRR